MIEMYYEEDVLSMRVSFIIGWKKIINVCRLCTKKHAGSPQFANSSLEDIIMAVQAS